MKFTIFNLLELVCFTTPIGCGVVAGWKLGGMAIVTGLATGLGVGVGAFCGLKMVEAYVGKYLDRLGECATAQVLCCSLLLFDLFSIVVSSYLSFFISTEVGRYLSA